MNDKQLKKAIEHEMGCKTTGEQEDFSLKTKKSHEHGKHPNSIKNLKPYKKGETGNPGGRPTKYAKLKKALINGEMKNLLMTFGMCLLLQQRQ